jgi:hypothetical protein
MKALIVHAIMLIGYACIGQILPGRAVNQQLKQSSNAVFEENKGQVKNHNLQARPDVLFYGNSEGINYYIRDNGISYQLSRVDSWKEEEDQLISRCIDNEVKSKVPDRVSAYRVDAEWINANTDFTVNKGKALNSYNNYYNVADGMNPALFVKQYETITLKNVWNGIDVHYFGTDGLLETDYIVDPGADYRRIQIQYKGAELSTDAKGNLIIKTPLGEIREGVLKVYQNNERIAAFWNIDNNNVVSFKIPHYNSDLAIRIDPVTQLWGTYYGGSDIDYGNDIATDVSGNVLVTGNTSSITSIATTGAHQSALVGINDAYLVKFDPDGIRLWATYYGGGASEQVNGIATDAFSNIVIVGLTQSTTDIATAGAHQTVYGGSTDAFIVKFNTSGIRLWGTYYGGNSYESGNSIATDVSGNILVTSRTNSTNAIASNGAYQTTIGGDADVFVVKFNSLGTRLWGTYYGGSGYDYGIDVATDASGNVLVTGGTESKTAIASSGSHQTTHGDEGETFVIEWDAFVVKFNASGSRIWGTYYGGSDYDKGESITTDALGNVIITGATESISSIASSTAHQITYGGGGDNGGFGDAFLAKFNASGTLVWGTYYGSSGSDIGHGIATDATGNVLITGQTNSPNDIASSGAYQTTIGGVADAFIVEFNPSGTRLWGTYYGGINEDNGYGITSDASGNILVTGFTSSESAIANNGAHQTSYGGGLDAFAVKFVENIITTYENTNDELDLSINPNPTNSNLNLSFNNTVETKINIRITNLLGSVLLEKTENLFATNTTITYNISEFETGLYLVHINNVKTQQVFKLLKE